MLANRRYVLARHPEERNVWLYELVSPLRNQDKPLIAQYYRAEGDVHWMYRQKPQDEYPPEPTWKFNDEDAHDLMLALMDHFGVKTNEAEVSARLDEVRKTSSEQIDYLRRLVGKLTDIKGV